MGLEGGGGYWCEGMSLLQGIFSMGEVGGGGYWCEGMVVVCNRGCLGVGMGVLV